MTLIAAGQLSSTSSLTLNGLKASQLIIKAANLGAKIIFLPEASDYIASSAAHSKSIVQPFDKSPFVIKLQETLKKLHGEGKFIDVVVGLHEPAIDDKLQRTQNTLVYLSSTGELLYRYQKLHLFDVDIPNGPIMKESLSVQPGKKLLDPFDTPAGKLGLGICYDLRFPEVGLALRSLGSQILTFPSAWTVKTGPQFQILGMALAVWSQCYLILPGQSGKHLTNLKCNATDATQIDHEIEDGISRESFGHTCIIDPLGTIIAQVSNIEVGDSDGLLGPGEGICIADIDLSKVGAVRERMPLWEQRREDVFGSLLPSESE